MLVYHFVGDETIPSNRIKDVEALREFIMNSLDIYMSLYDVYRLWDRVSDDWDAGWLYIDTHYYDETREEFLLTQIHKYCKREFKVYHEL